MRTALLLPLALLGACATPIPPAGASDIYHYLRTNRDGTEAEHVVQYRPTRETIAVYKWMSKCNTAAYVTAQMDPAVREGLQYIAGKVARDGSQAAFGTLALDPAEPALVVEIDPPGGSHLSMRHKLEGRPFLLYDFDFADLNAFLQEARPRTSFSYELPLIWPDDPAIFRDLGRMTATYAGEERRLGRATRRFDLRVDGPKPTTGTLWIDAGRGFIVEAELGLPNHAEYRDFRLTLEKVQPGGQRAFDALTRGHHAACPAD